MPTIRAALAALLLLISSCAVLTEPDAGTSLTLYVAPYRTDCVGAFPQRCLLVKERPTAEWELFYSQIEGFEHEPGFTYHLLVSRRRIADPPQDGSAFEWHLIRIIEKVPV